MRKYRILLKDILIFLGLFRDVTFMILYLIALGTLFQILILEKVAFKKVINQHILNERTDFSETTLELICFLYRILLLHESSCKV